MLILRNFKFNELEVLILRELRIRFRGCVDSPEVSAGGLKIERSRARNVRQLDRTRPRLVRAVQVETSARLKIADRIGKNGDGLPKNIRECSILSFS